jgi:hypothetical protein
MGTPSTWILLPTLTADDLKDLAVSVAGRRQRPLNAIATLEDGAKAADDWKTIEPEPTGWGVRRASGVFDGGGPISLPKNGRRCRQR